MDLRKLKTLIDLVSESNISELEITEADGKVRIVKAEPVRAALAPAMILPMQPQGAPVGAPAAPAVEPGHVVKSPMVGTFYRASSPDAKPFVEVGSTIREGQALCIVEAMKLMNEIEAKVAGHVVKVFPENGQPVEYGQPLFLIDPAR